MTAYLLDTNHASPLVTLHHPQILVSRCDHPAYPTRRSAASGDLVIALPPVQRTG